MRLILECSPKPVIYDRATGIRYPISQELHDLLDSVMHSAETNDLEKEIRQLCLSV